MKHTLIVLGYFLFCADLIESQELWPVLSCHDGFNAELYNKNHDLCKQGDPSNIEKGVEIKPERLCYKACMLLVLGILPTDAQTNITLSDLDYMFDMMTNFFPRNTGQAHALSEKVVDECSVDKINEKQSKCPEWDELYTCIDYTITCGTIIGG